MIKIRKRHFRKNKIKLKIKNQKRKKNNINGDKE